MLNIDNYIDENGLFDGRYKFIHLLDNEGGSADVWLAEDMLTAETEQIDSSDGHEEVSDTGVMVAIKICQRGG